VERILLARALVVATEQDSNDMRLSCKKEIIFSR
jgi:hypothetical protein